MLKSPLTSVLKLKEPQAKPELLLIMVLFWNFSFQLSNPHYCSQSSIYLKNILAKSLQNQKISEKKLGTLSQRKNLK